MSNKATYSHLFFNESNCLTALQMKNYVQNNLSADEKRVVENHLLECEFCSDAVEGLKQNQVGDYQKEIELLNLQIKRRTNYSQRKKIIYSPWRIIGVAASVLFLVMGLGIYFGWFLNTRFENVAKNISDLSSKVSSLASISKKEKTDTVTIIKDKAAENPYSRNVSATDDTSPLNEEMEKQNDTIQKSSEEMVAQNSISTDANKPESITNADKSATSKALDDAESKKMMPKKLIQKVENNSTAPTLVSASNLSENNNEKNFVIDKNPDAIEGLKQYNSKNYAKTISLLNNVVAKEPNNFEAKYYLGMSYMQLNKNIEAITQFDAILLTNDQEWFDDARYQKALAHLNIEDKLTAETIFQQIIAENGKYKTEAEQQMVSIKK